MKHDFLTEAVRLGHQDGLRVMGYFCMGSNTRWGKDHPDLSYGIPSSPHLPYTDEYLSYLSAAIRDAVQRTGIDGFMIDWLMNEGGDIERVEAVKPMIGKHTRLITCLANWNRQDPTTIVPAALQHGIGLYGFTKPQADSLVPLEPCLTQPVRQLSGDARNLGALSRAYHGVPLDSIRNEQGVFVAEPR